MLNVFETPGLESRMSLVRVGGIAGRRQEIKG
jgi:hypothetical protein